MLQLYRDAGRGCTHGINKKSILKRMLDTYSLHARYTFDSERPTPAHTDSAESNTSTRTRIQDADYRSPRLISALSPLPPSFGARKCSL